MDSKRKSKNKTNLNSGIEMSCKRIKLSNSTLEILVFGSFIKKVKQDSLGRVYVWTIPSEKYLKIA